MFLHYFVGNNAQIYDWRWHLVFSPSRDCHKCPGGHAAAEDDIKKGEY